MLMRIYVLMRKILVETGGKVVLVINWLRNLAELGSSVLGKIELGSNETGYLCLVIFSKFERRSYYVM
jgi:hypothetical protein